MDLLVYFPDIALWAGRRMRCALGRAGISTRKREGDGATPAGAWPMRRLLYRPDRLAPPVTRLPTIPLSLTDGWCDDPNDPNYNRPVTLPYAASAEALWRKDNVYDLIVPLGYNDDSIVPGLGSAIFLHLAKPNFAPTEGCIALSLADLVAILGSADGGSRVVVHAVGAKPA